MKVFVIGSSSYVYIFFLFLIMTINLCSFSPSCSATDESLNPHIHVVPLIYIANETGELFNIDINISNVNNLQSVEFKLSYNASLLDAVQVVQGSFLPPPPQSSVMFDINKSSGFVWVSISAGDSEPGRSGNGTLARITFNVTLGAKCSFIILHLQDTSLYDDSMTEISHSSIDGLYFWKSLQPDPPIQGGLLDLFTQKGGVGSGEPAGVFFEGEIVELYSNVTYNNWPEQQKLVAFQVIEPIGSTVLILFATTDQNGSANISFRIPRLPDSYGLWTAISIAEIAGETVWDIVQFQCVPSLVGGFSESVNIPSSSRAHARTYYMILVVVIASIFIWITQKMKKPISSSKTMGNSSIICGEKGKKKNLLIGFFYYRRFLHKF